MLPYYIFGVATYSNDMRSIVALLQAVVVVKPRKSAKMPRGSLFPYLCPRHQTEGRYFMTPLHPFSFSYLPAQESLDPEVRSHYKHACKYPKQVEYVKRDDHTALSTWD
ncbi:hypothetical protein KC361_g56 [Hortaea werneckii]|nr:hypothetical protein KC361_g56 [Hortaea werneckii]